MRLKHTVLVQITQDTDGKRTLYSDESTAAKIDTERFDGQANSLLAIDSETTEVLSLGDVTDVRGLYLEVDQDAIVYLNDSADGIQLKMPPGGTKAKLFLEAEITKVEVENTSATAALSGVYVLWGTPN